MTLANLQSYYFRRLNLDATSFPAADQVIALNTAADRVHSRIRVFLDTFYPTAWTTTELGTGTATPKFDANFHELIALWVCYDIANELGKSSVKGFAEKIKLLGEELDLFYGTRDFHIFTVTIASPGVFTSKGHGLRRGDTIVFTTTGALPTGLTADTVRYYVITDGLTNDEFKVSATIDGAAVNTSGTQSGTHYLASGKPKRFNLSTTGQGWQSGRLGGNWSDSNR